MIIKKFDKDYIIQKLMKNVEYYCNTYKQWQVYVFLCQYNFSKMEKDIEFYKEKIVELNKINDLLEENYLCVNIKDKYGDSDSVGLEKISWSFEEEYCEEFEGIEIYFNLIVNSKLEVDLEIYRVEFD